MIILQVSNFKFTVKFGVEQGILPFMGFGSARYAEAGMLFVPVKKIGPWARAWAEVVA